jgi:hypothetical protein
MNSQNEKQNPAPVTNFIENILTIVSNTITNPSAFILLIIALIFAAVVYSYLGVSSTNSYETTSSQSSSFYLLSIIAMIIYLVYIIFGINVFQSVNDLIFKERKITVDADITIDKTRFTPSVVPQLKFRKQPFNIPGNTYSYPDAKALCTAYGARLANYSEIEDAYNDGGEWCNYGWSEGQMALYPTQKSSYDKLQKIEGHEHDCGRPGVNGGYIADPNAKFGVNCYGYKPKITSDAEELMANTSPFPKSQKDIELEERVQKMKGEVKNILVSPFNYTTWSRF